MDKEYYYCENCDIFITENLNICPICKQKTSIKKINPFSEYKDKNNASKKYMEK